MLNACAQTVRTTPGNVLKDSVRLFTGVLLMCSVGLYTLVQLVTFKQSVRRITQGLYAGKNDIFNLLNIFFTHNPQGLLLSRKGI